MNRVPWAYPGANKHSSAETLTALARIPGESCVSGMSSKSEGYAVPCAIQTIYRRLVGRSSADTLEETLPSAADTLSSAFDLMELSSPSPSPAKASKAKVLRTDDAARATYDEAFTDPNALDYLMRCTHDSKNFMTDPRKESLLVRFDPLRTARSVTESFLDVKKSNMESDCGYDTGSNTSIMDKAVITPKRTASVNIPREKPTQVVNPAVNRTLPAEFTRPPLVRSASAIMSPARVAIDRLISYGEHSSPPINLLNGSPHYDAHLDGLYSLKAMQQKQEHEAMQLREEYSDLKFRIRDLEKECQRMSEENKELKEKEKRLTRQLQEKSLSNRQMVTAMDAYEKTISSLVDEQQSDKAMFADKEKMLRVEQEQTQSHLLSMESAFNDLLAKYEKCKIRMNEFKEQEESHRKSILQYERANADLEQQYTMFKNMASEKLSKANETLDSLKKSQECELMKLNATIKKLEVQVSSLSESLAQKTKDNEQLTIICDELIGKVH